MKDIYKIYLTVPKKVYTRDIIEFYNASHATVKFVGDYAIIPYAFTDKKELAKQFVNERSKRNLHIEKDSCLKEEWKDIKDRYASLMLKERAFYSNPVTSHGRVDFLCPKFEHDACVMTADTTMFTALQEENAIMTINPNIFTTEYYQLLRILGYTEICKSFSSIDEETMTLDEYDDYIAELEVMAYNESYGLDSDGKKPIINMKYNELFIYMYISKYSREVYD